VLCCLEVLSVCLSSLMMMMMVMLANKSRRLS
jgi:hypothetical protein